MDKEVKELRCNNAYCPMSKHCETFSTNDKEFILIEKEFDFGSESDEQYFYCESFFIQ
jgi:hypothetical protein